MKVFIIGASGLVGSYCLEYLSATGWDVKGTHVNFSTGKTIFFNPSNSEFEKDFDLIAYRPDVIIHCGALTNVDYCENNIKESEYSTLNSTFNIVNFCKRTNVKLIYISTDYVFDGKNGPYSEKDIVNPLNVYGRHKLAAEELVQSLPEYIIARVTNVYGEEARSKNFIARLILWIRENEKKTLLLPIDQFATPVFAGDIAQMLYHLINDKKIGIYNLSSTDYYDRYHLALKVKSYFPDKDTVKVDYTTTDLLKQPALRPLNGGLLNGKFLREYPQFSLNNIDSFIQRVIKL